MILANISHIRGANLEFSIQVLMLFSPLLSDVGVLIFECHENVTKKKRIEPPNRDYSRTSNSGI